jgi:hypothetical protein
LRTGTTVEAGAAADLEQKRRGNGNVRGWREGKTKAFFGQFSVDWISVLRFYLEYLGQDVFALIITCSWLIKSRKKIIALTSRHYMKHLFILFTKETR